MKLIFVHGRSQGDKDPVVLKQTWEASFDEGLANAGLSRPPALDVASPFYGSALDDLVEQLETPLISDVNEKGAAQDDDEAAFRGEFLAELADINGITDDQIAEFLDGGVQEKGVLNWKWVHAILKAFDKNKKMGDVVLDKFTRDVYVYLTNAGVRQRINNIVAAEMTEDPCVVVGHSLGSIVAYNVLREHGHKVNRYITVGSPLGLKSVKSRLQVVEMPATTSSWSNARDRNDVVALFPLNKNHFSTDPAIKNHNDVDNQTDNQHGIVGYLPDSWVAKSIHDALVGA